MSNNKQSSVEWVIENLTLIHALLSRREIGVEFFNRRYNEIVEQGKAMHKEEVLNFDSLLDKHQINAYKNNTIYLSREEFYNETFGGEQ